MKPKKNISVLVLSIVLGSGVFTAQAGDWTRGCGAVHLPQGTYQDLRYAEPPEYFSPERFVSWDADQWVRRDRRVRTVGAPSANNFRDRYRDNPRAYGQQNYYDPYAVYGHAPVAYQGRSIQHRPIQTRSVQPDRYAYESEQYAPQYPDDYRYRSAGRNRPVQLDDRYGNEYTRAGAGIYESYPYQKQAQELIKKEAVYSPGRVYTPPQSAIVGEPSSAPYGGGLARKMGREGSTGVVLPGPEAVSNAYFSRHGRSVDNTQKMSAMPTQGQK